MTMPLSALMVLAILAPGETGGAEVLPEQVPWAVEPQRPAPEARSHARTRWDGPRDLPMPRPSAAPGCSSKSPAVRNSIGCSPRPSCRPWRPPRSAASQCASPGGRSTATSPCSTPAWPSPCAGPGLLGPVHRQASYPRPRLRGRLPFVPAPRRAGPRAVPARWRRTRSSRPSTGRSSPAWRAGAAPRRAAVAPGLVRPGLGRAEPRQGGPRPAGLLAANWVRAHVRLLDLGLKSAGADLAVELPFSGYGPLTEAAVALADHVVERIGPSNPTFFCQANGWGPGGDWGAPDARTEAAFDRVWRRPICRGQQAIQPGDYDWPSCIGRSRRTRRRTARSTPPAS